MLERLQRLQQLRGAAAQRNGQGADFESRVKAVKLWQQQRLARCYADLAADVRYTPAVAFFLDEIYGIKDSTVRDRDLVRMYPTIKRIFPKIAFDACDKALELDVLSEEFDQAIAVALGSQPLTEANYLKAFRAVDRQQDRLRQIVLMQAVGEALDNMVQKPLLFATLKMLHGPAQMVGLGAMQQFLETGFSAFRHMKRADHFLATIAYRERVLIERIMQGEPAPFSIIEEWNS